MSKKAIKRTNKRVRKYAEGGQVTDPVDMGGGGGTSPRRPITEDEWNNLKKKYAGGLPQVKPWGSSTPGGALDRRMQWIKWADQKLPTSGTPVELAARAAKATGFNNPSLLLASSLEEGVGLRYDPNKAYSGAYVVANDQGQLEGFPVDGFRAYGLDQIGARVDEFINKGYLPKDFKNKLKVFDASNEIDEREYYKTVFDRVSEYEGLLKPGEKFSPNRSTYNRLDSILDEYEIEGVPEMKKSAKTAAFVDDEAAFMAKAAFLRAEQDSVNKYAKSRGFNLTPEEQEFFTLASYNGGFGAAKKMLDYYAGKKGLGNNLFLKDKGTSSIYDNILPRYAGSQLFRGEGYFNYGGKMPRKKYPDGGEIDPITGQPKDAQLTNKLGVDVWQNAANTPVPINPNAPINEQIFPIDPQQQNPQNQQNIVPLSQMYEYERDRFGNEVPVGTGRYVDFMGNPNTLQDQQAKFDLVSDLNRLNAERREKNIDNAEFALSAGMTAINSYFNKQNSAQQRRADRRSAIMQEVEAFKLNPYLEGTGSQAIMKKGGKIHIKPENRGKFTAAAKRAGKSVQAYAAQIMANPDNYSPTLRKRANFARNAAKWHEFGGEIDEIQGDDLGIQTLDGGKSKLISSSNHSNPMVEFSGKEHKQGGIGIQYGGNVAEVEDKEVGWIDAEGSLNIFGKLKLPGTNQTFRKAAKDIAKQESKVDGMKSKYLNILNNGDPTDPYQESAQSTAKVMFKSLDKQSRKIAEKKEALADYQNLILTLVQTQQIDNDMNYGGKMPKKPYNYGGKIPRKPYAYGGIMPKMPSMPSMPSIKVMANGGDLPPGSYINKTGYHNSQMARALMMFAMNQDQVGNPYYFNTGDFEFNSTITENRRRKYETDGEIGNNDPKTIQAIIDKYSGGKSPLKAEDFIEVSKKYGVPLDLMLAQAIQESNIGTKGRAVRTKNIFNVGNTDDGTESHNDSWKAGLERYAKLIRDEYSKDPNNVTTQEILMNDFVRPGRGGRYATDPMYTSRVASILNEINPGKNYSYINASGGGSGTASSGSNNTGTGSGNGLVGSTTNTSNLYNFNPVHQPIYQPIGNSGAGAGAGVVNTKYGAARREATPFSDRVNISKGNKERDYLSPLAMEQIAPELLTIATNRQDAVPQLSYQPDLKQTFDISYQLGRNENQSSFNQIAKIAEQTGNVDALSQLAAQKYKADEAYNMQEIQGNATQRLNTYSQNVDVLNDAKLKNLALIADQQIKQAQAKFNTRKEDLSAFTSISGKVLQNRLENITYNAYANLFKHYGFDKKGNVTFNADDVVQRFSPGEAKQFGFMAAQQGANAIMNGDFSRRFTRVKNDGGGTTTTETLGTNKKIQEEYKALKSQGFDDNIIGNMLRAKYPQTITQD